MRKKELKGLDIRKVSKFLSITEKYDEIILLWNGMDAYNGKSLISLVNVIASDKKTYVEIITYDEDIADKFYKEIDKLLNE
jgi:hypothetical protein